MESIPRVSVILPNYNYAKYLDERIQSLLNQTFQDFELIILDDNSTDNSIEVINKYAFNEKIKTFFYKENSGLTYKRWNDGADLSRGEYLLFAGADDVCDKTMLEKLVSKLDNHPSAGLAFSQSWEINSEGEKIRSLKVGTDFLDKKRWEADFVDDGKKECFYLLFQNTIPNASAVLIRRKCFFESGKFDESLLLLADWMLWVKILLKSDLAYVAEPLNYFRTHPANVRKSHAANGVYVEESYQILSQLLGNIHIQKDTAERIFENRMKIWVRSLLAKEIKIPLKRNLSIYKRSKRLDPKTNIRFAKKFMLIFLKKIQSKYSASSPKVFRNFIPLLFN